MNFTYTWTMTPPTDTQIIEVWIPIPINSDRQTVQLVSVSDPVGRFTTDPKYGNRMFYRKYNRLEEKISDTITLIFTYKLVLLEKEVREAKELAPLPKVKADENLQVYLSDNRLIPLVGNVSNLERSMLLSDKPILAARQVYDRLISTMTYNHNAPGAGVGDAALACNSKTGDCSDYHSVFIGVCRAAGIPADHVFGIPLRNTQPNHTIKYWHCWAQFWVKDAGWITIDASEADKHPELKEYLFGTLSNDYLVVSHGRDVILEPKQKGEALNIFADPYVELDGKP
ncbi:MAG: transglutaminase-like domain-containing protein, partial [Cyclobacteriaceae bacterium]